MRRVLLPVALALSVALGAACAGDDSDGATTTTAAPTTEPASSLTVQVFFLDQDAFDVGRPPYVTPVDRTVDAEDAPAGALDALFAGPTADEGAGGLRFVASEATGYTDLRIEDGTAHVTLTGGCSSGGSTFTVADEIVPTLLQFTEVDAVKVYDPEGETEAPDEPGDSIPFCLEP